MRAELADIPFEVALERGLGRAILFLEEQTDPRPFRELLTEACLNNWSYDRQTEDNRAAYVFDAIHATGEPEFYAARVRRALLDLGTACDRHQVFDLVALFARSGDDEAKAALYQAFPDALKAGYASLCESLIRLDGIAGYLFVADLFARTEEAMEEWEHEAAITNLAEAVGVKPPVDALETACTLRPDLRDYIQQTFARWTVNQAKTAATMTQSHEEPITYEMVIQVINGQAERKEVPLSWARRLDDATHHRLAEDMAEATDPGRLLQFLRLLRERPFPLDPLLLLPQVRHSAAVVGWRTAQILGKTTHPAIRAYALELLDDADFVLHGLALLPCNPGNGDCARFQQLLTQAADDMARHGVIQEGRHYLERQMPDGSNALLLEMYRQSPCGICRLAVLEILEDATGYLPAWVIEEARYDAYNHTRRFMESVVSHPPHPRYEPRVR